MKTFFISFIIWLIFIVCILPLLQNEIVYAQFDDIGETHQSLKKVDLDPRNNLSILCLMKEINTDGIHESGQYFRFRYEYQMENFSDSTDWRQLLDFRPVSSLSKIKNNGAEWNTIKEIKISLKGKRGFIVPTEILDKTEENFILSPKSFDSNILRKMEIILKDIHITIPMIPEQPPESIGGGGLMGVANLRTYDVGQIDFITPKGVFFIRLSFPLKLKSSGSLLEYPIYDTCLTIKIDEIIHQKTGKHIPKDVFDYWSGKKIMDQKIIEINSVDYESKE
jgi:hypothetical protein